MRVPFFSSVVNRPERLTLYVPALSLFVTLVGAVPAAKAQILTDITLFRLDASNNSISEGFNTRGGDGISNLYLTSGGSFINSGNGASTSIAINLSTPGTYTFNFAGENVNGNVAPQLGLNLFFNNANTPGISARGLSPTGFVANGGTTSSPTFGAVAGANTLVFAGAQQVTLSNFTYQTNSGADQVQSFNNVPGGTTDTIGSFTLTVGTPSAAPEASPFALLALGGFTGGIVAMQRKIAAR